MSVAAPPRPTEAIPYAESQPQRVLRHAAPDWLPVIGWFVDDGQRHSRVNVVPMGNTVDPHERFGVTLKFFRGAEQPVHTFLSEPFAGDQIFRYESADLLHAMQSQKAGGIMHKLNVIQEQYGGFCITVVPKVLLNFVGNVFRFYGTLSGSEAATYEDVYNTYVVLGHQIAMLVVITMLFIRRGLRLSSINVYFALFYSILFSMSILAIASPSPPLLIC